MPEMPEMAESDAEMAAATAVEKSAPASAVDRASVFRSVMCFLPLK